MTYFDADDLARREDLDRRRETITRRRRIILFSILGVLVLFVVFILVYNFTDVMFGISEELESAPQNGDWVMFRHDQSHTGSTGAGGSIDGVLRWTFPTEGPIHSSPAVVDGVVYFGSQDHHIYALEVETGEEIWSFETGSFVDSSPIVVGGVLYCGSNDGNLYALDAATGAELWRFEARYGMRSSPAIAGGRVYIGSEDNHLYAVDAVTGKEIWKVKTRKGILSSPVVTKGVVVVGSTDGSFYAINAANGKQRLDFRTNAIIGSSPAVQDGIAYFTTSAGLLQAIDVMAKNWFLENRLTVYWRTLYVYGVAPNPPVPSGYLWALPLGSVDRVSSSLAIYDGTIYLGAGSSLLSLKLTDGTPNWNYSAGDWVLSSPAVTDEAVYFGSNDGHVYALDRATGTRLWDYLTGDDVTSSPAVADGMLFVGSEDGQFYAFD